MKAVSSLKFNIVGKWNRARASVMTLPHGDVFTPVFMPVGTKGIPTLPISDSVRNREGHDHRTDERGAHRLPGISLSLTLTVLDLPWKHLPSQQ